MPQMGPLSWVSVSFMSLILVMVLIMLVYFTPKVSSLKMAGSTVKFSYLWEW